MRSSNFVERGFALRDLDLNFLCLTGGISIHFQILFRLNSMIHDLNPILKLLLLN